MIDIPCIIFAGGKSSRMGEDKALLPFGEFSTLTEFQLHKLQKIFTHVYISCKDKNKFHFKAQFIEDIQSHNVYAPTTGFLAVFEKFQFSKFFVLSVDTPFVNKNEITIAIIGVIIQVKYVFFVTGFEKVILCPFFNPLIANNEATLIITKDCGTPNKEAIIIKVPVTRQIIVAVRSPRGTIFWLVVFKDP